MRQAGDKIEPFFAYMGNKASLAEWIVPNIMACPHKTYIEVFGGTFALGLNKPKSPVEIYNDYNGHLSNLFHVIRTKWDEFEAAWDELIISEYWYKHIFYDNHDDYGEVENAVRYFYIMSMAFMGKYNGGFFYKDNKSFCEILEKKKNVAKEIHKRIKNVIILNKNCFDVVKMNNKKDTLLYLDPPYVDTELYYKHLAGAFTEVDHIELRDYLAKHKGYFFLSYEDDELVNDLYSEFNFLRKQQFRASNNTVRKEVLVSNYQPTNTLFS